MKGLVEEVAEASQQQTQGLDQVSQAISQMEKVTQATAATAEESAATSEELSAQATMTMETIEQLNRLVGQASVEGAAPAPQPRASAGSPRRQATVVPLRGRAPKAAAPAEDALPLEGTGTFGSF